MTDADRDRVLLEMHGELKGIAAKIDGLGDTSADHGRRLDTLTGRVDSLTSRADKVEGAIASARWLFGLSGTAAGVALSKLFGGTP